VAHQEADPIPAGYAGRQQNPEKGPKPFQDLPGGTHYSSRIDLRSTTDSAKLATPAAPFLVMTPLRFKKNP